MYELLLRQVNGPAHLDAPLTDMVRILLRFGPIQRRAQGSVKMQDKPLIMEVLCSSGHLQESHSRGSSVWSRMRLGVLHAKMSWMKWGSSFSTELNGEPELQTILCGTDSLVKGSRVRISIQQVESPHQGTIGDRRARWCDGFNCVLAVGFRAFSGNLSSKGQHRTYPVRQGASGSEQVLRDSILISMMKLMTNASWGRMRGMTPLALSSVRSAPARIPLPPLLTRIFDVHL